ncbi:MAG: hypothetical protein M1476_01220 [Candidatus Thermoplasmatota archaeon]|nr:hypothetical protein [Candidatus Thermoplasmatota archaeon]
MLAQEFLSKMNTLQKMRFEAILSEFREKGLTHEQVIEEILKNLRKAVS